MRIAQALLLPPDIVHADVLPAGTCDDNTLAVSVNAAAGWGLISAAAAGNSGDKAKILSPACASKAVAVGAVYSTDATAVGICQGKGIQMDKVTCFSNRWAFAKEEIWGIVYATSVGRQREKFPHVKSTAFTPENGTSAALWGCQIQNKPTVREHQTVCCLSATYRHIH